MFFDFIQINFDIKGKTLPKTTSLMVQRIFPIQKNEEVLWISKSLIRQLLFERVRGKPGATYSPSVNFSMTYDHVLGDISIKIAPEFLEQVRSIISETLQEIAARDERHVSLFNELKSAYIEKLKLSDPSVADMANAAVGMLNDLGKIVSLKEQYENTVKLTYADVAKLIETEFAPQQLFWYITKP